MANVFKAMATVDRKIYFLLLLAVIVGGLLRPLVIPIEITHWTKKFYDDINDIQPDEIVVIHMGSGPGVRRTMWSAYTLSFWQIIQRRPRIIWMTTMPEAFPVGEMMLNDPVVKAAMEEANYVEGVNFIDIGFVYGEPALVNLVQDFQDFTKGKFKGTWLDEVKDFNDVDHLLWLGGNPNSYKWCAQHISLRYKTKIYTISEPTTFPTHLIYLDAGNFQACMNGVTGSAEYEIITNNIGEAITYMGVVSITHVLFVVIIIIGNIGYFGWERKEREKMRSS